MNWAGFIPSGILITLFGVSLIQLLPKHFLARVGSILILTYGLGTVVVGFLSCDPGCPQVGSLENNFHDQISGPTFMSAIAGILILGISFRRLHFWKKFWIYSVVSALVSVVFLIGLINSIESSTYTGTWQRLLLITIFLWVSIVGMQIYRTLKNDDTFFKN
jgi:hypothetical protein